MKISYNLWLDYLAVLYPVNATIVSPKEEFSGTIDSVYTEISDLGLRYPYARVKWNKTSGTFSDGFLQNCSLMDLYEERWFVLVDKTKK